MATELVIPMLGVTVENGRIVEWLKAEGEAVEKGESIFVVEADKVTTEVESPVSGILARILLEAGKEVPVLSLAGIITEPGEEIPSTDTDSAQKASADAGAAGASPRTVSAARAPRVSASTPALPGRVKIMPAARRLAREKNLDLQTVSPTGPDGVITHEDVVIAVSTPPKQLRAKVSTLARRQADAAGVPLEGIEGTGIRGRIMRADVDAAVSRAAAGAPEIPSTAETDSMFGSVIPMDNMRRTIARRLSNSAFSAPHVSFYTDVRMDPLLSYRKGILEAFQNRFALRPSINDFLIKAVALTIRDFPLLNGSLQGDEIHIMPHIHIGLAVAIPNGLVVPAIAHADRMGLSDIVRQRNDLVSRALNGQLTVEEMERGTFTISSLARSDITFFTSIVNPPQSGILSVGKTREELGLVAGEVTVNHVSSMGLTVDHRMIDGTMAADFIQCLKGRLETPGFTFMHV